MDGHGTLFGTLTGNNREVLHKFEVDLPKKHGRGGQSAARFARIREEKRHNYVRKVSEIAVKYFITNDKVNVNGIVLAGSADFKTELGQSEMLDKRLRVSIVKEVDISYGGERGFTQAIDLSAEHLQNVKFMQEKVLISKFFDEISQDTGKYVYGIHDTLKGLENGAVETLIVWENIELVRYVLRIPGQEMEIVKFLAPSEETERKHFVQDNTELDVVEQVPALEWLAEHYKDYGTTLEIVSNRSQEGSQFVSGFGGIGGLLRYKVDFQAIALLDEADEFLSDDDY